MHRTNSGDDNRYFTPGMVRTLCTANPNIFKSSVYPPWHFRVHKIYQMMNVTTDQKFSQKHSWSRLVTLPCAMKHTCQFWSEVQRLSWYASHVFFLSSSSQHTDWCLQPLPLHMHTHSRSWMEQDYRWQLLTVQSCLYSSWMGSREPYKLSFGMNATEHH